MVDLAKSRLRPFGRRAEVRRSAGEPHIDAADGTFDRFICTYVFDLLPDDDIRAILTEARRILTPRRVARHCQFDERSAHALPVGIYSVARFTSSVAMARWWLPPDFNPHLRLEWAMAHQLREHCRALRHPLGNRRGKTTGLLECPTDSTLKSGRLPQRWLNDPALDGSAPFGRPRLSGNPNVIPARSSFTGRPFTSA